MEQSNSTSKRNKLHHYLKKSDFDIDKHINPFLFSSQPIFSLLPPYISRFFGYRDTTSPEVYRKLEEELEREEEENEKYNSASGKIRRHHRRRKIRRGPKIDKPLPDLLRSFWVLFSTFAGLILAMLCMHYSNLFNGKYHAPVIIPSWAATSILIYNAIESPLGQPRNTFFGTILSSIVGISITKLFMLNSNNEQHLWVCGALCVGVASVVMGLTKTVHPPGGASALVAAIDPKVRALGWFYLVVQIVTALIMLGAACLFNNIQRRYPLYWWSPLTLKTRQLPRRINRRRRQEKSSGNTGKKNDDSGVPENPVNHQKHYAQPILTTTTPSSTTMPSEQQQKSINISRTPDLESRKNSSSSFDYSSLGSSTMGNKHSKQQSQNNSSQEYPRNDDDDEIQQQQSVQPYSPEQSTSHPHPSVQRKSSITSLTRGLARVLTTNSQYSHVIGTRENDMGDLIVPDATERDIDSIISRGQEEQEEDDDGNGNTLRPVTSTREGAVVTSPEEQTQLDSLTRIVSNQEAYDEAAHIKALHENEAGPSSSSSSAHKLRKFQTVSANEISHSRHLGPSLSRKQTRKQQHEKDAKELQQDSRTATAVVILPDHFSLPAGLELTEEEQVLLGRIQEQLKAMQVEKLEKMQGDGIV